MNILYLHGFGSRFNIKNEKIQILQKIGNVCGGNIDYRSSEKAIASAIDVIETQDSIDMVIGTSMGGWLASYVSSMYCIPFVALNPATSPKENLMKYAGHYTDYSGCAQYIDIKNIREYPDIYLDGYGMVLLEENDIVIDPTNTLSKLNKYYDVRMYPGGSHRFESLDDRLEDIIQFYHSSYDFFHTK